MKPKRGSKGGASQKAAEWRQAARADLFAIVDYISLDNPDAALQLLDEIEDKVMKLASARNCTGWAELPAHVKWS